MVQRKTSVERQTPWRSPLLPSSQLSLLGRNYDIIHSNIQLLWRGLTPGYLPWPRVFPSPRWSPLCTNERAPANGCKTSTAGEERGERREIKRIGIQEGYLIHDTWYEKHVYHHMFHFFCLLLNFWLSNLNKRIRYQPTTFTQRIITNNAQAVDVARVWDKYHAHSGERNGGMGSKKVRSVTKAEACMISHGLGGHLLDIIEVCCLFICFVCMPLTSPLLSHRDRLDSFLTQFVWFMSTPSQVNSTDKTQSFLLCIVANICFLPSSWFIFFRSFCRILLVGEVGFLICVFGGVKKRLAWKKEGEKGK